MSYDVVIDRTVIKNIKKYPKHDIQRIKETLNKLTAFPEGLDTKKLSGTRNIYRIRVGDYRILVELEVHTLSVFSVAHRKKAYNRSWN